MTRPTCPATVKRGPRAGQVCGKPTSLDLETCIAHAPADTRRRLAFHGPTPGSGRPRLERPTEAMQRLVEENVLAVLRPHFMALGYDVVLKDGRPALQEGVMPTLTAAFQGEVSQSDVVDLGAMLEAAEKLLDRVYGRPRQALEHTGADGERLTFADLAGLARPGGAT